jgi:hypothetical protein
MKRSLKEKSEVLDLSYMKYRLSYSNKSLLSNILTGIRVIRGVSVVYQRDSIKKSGNVMIVPIELGYLKPEGYGSTDTYIQDFENAARKIKGVIKISSIQSFVSV